MFIQTGLLVLCLIVCCSKNIKAQIKFTANSSLTEFVVQKSSSFKIMFDRGLPDHTRILVRCIYVIQKQLLMLYHLFPAFFLSQAWWSFLLWICLTYENPFFHHQEKDFAFVFHLLYLYMKCDRLSINLTNFL